MEVKKPTSIILGLALQVGLFILLLALAHIGWKYLNMVELYLHNDSIVLTINQDINRSLLNDDGSETGFKNLRRSSYNSLKTDTDLSLSSYENSDKLKQSMLKSFEKENENKNEKEKVINLTENLIVMSEGLFNLREQIQSDFVLFSQQQKNLALGVILGFMGLLFLWININWKRFATYTIYDLKTIFGLLEKDKKGLETLNTLYGNEVTNVISSYDSKKENNKEPSSIVNLSDYNHSIKKKDDIIQNLQNLIVTSQRNDLRGEEILSSRSKLETVWQDILLDLKSIVNKAKKAAGERKLNNLLLNKNKHNLKQLTDAKTEASHDLLGLKNKQIFLDKLLLSIKDNANKGLGVVESCRQNIDGTEGLLNQSLFPIKDIFDRLKKSDKSYLELIDALKETKIVFDNILLVVNNSVPRIDLLKKETSFVKEKSEKCLSLIQQMLKPFDIIEGVAKQTSIVALNASIEAAKAGEKGTGFAVVADQISGMAGQLSAAISTIVTLAQKLNQDQTTVNKLITNLNVEQESVVSAINSDKNSLEYLVQSYNNLLQMVSGLKDHNEDLVYKLEETVTNYSSNEDDMNQLKRTLDDLHYVARTISNDLSSAGSLGVNIKEQTQKIESTVEELGQLLHLVEDYSQKYNESMENYDDNISRLTGEAENIFDKIVQLIDDEQLDYHDITKLIQYITVFENKLEELRYKQEELSKVEKKYGIAS